MKAFWRANRHLDTQTDRQEAEVEQYEEDNEEDDDAEKATFKETETIPFTTLIGRYMSCGDRSLLFIGYGGAVIYGSALPAFCVLFGGMIDNVGGQEFDESTGM